MHTREETTTPTQKPAPPTSASCTRRPGAGCWRTSSRGTRSRCGAARHWPALPPAIYQASCMPCCSPVTAACACPCPVSAVHASACNPVRHGDKASHVQPATSLTVCVHGQRVIEERRAARIAAANAECAESGGAQRWAERRLLEVNICSKCVFHTRIYISTCMHSARQLPRYASLHCTHMQSACCPGNA